jgi:hypothetical protein
MSLVGLLSNRGLKALLQFLTSRAWKQAQRRPLFARGGAPDGRRKFGTVRDAILAVLEDAGSALRVRDIHERVEKLLGEPSPRRQ